MGEILAHGAFSFVSGVAVAVTGFGCDFTRELFAQLGADPAAHPASSPINMGLCAALVTAVQASVCMLVHLQGGQLGLWPYDSRELSGQVTGSLFDTCTARGGYAFAALWYTAVLVLMFSAAEATQAQARRARRDTAVVRAFCNCCSCARGNTPVRARSSFWHLLVVG